MSDLLPISATKQERNISLATVRAGEVPNPIKTLWNADTVAVNLLPWLAWSLSVDTWDANWPEFTKRAVVRAAVDTARRKGTKKAVKDALAALGAGTVLVEWFEKTPASDPHTFTINIVSADVSTAMQASIASEIDRTKPLRSHYDIVFGVIGEASINIAAILRPTVFARLDGGATY